MADEWDKLRGCDVERLLNDCMGIMGGTLEHLADYAAVILDKREDLEDRVKEAFEIISEEWIEAQ